MAEIVEDIVVELGAYFEKEFTWLDADNLPVNMSGWTGVVQFRSSLSAETAMVNKPLDLSTSGIVWFDLPLPHTYLSGKKAMYAIELTPPSGKTLRFAEGAVELSPRLIR